MATIKMRRRIVGEGITEREILESDPPREQPAAFRADVETTRAFFEGVLGGPQGEYADPKHREAVEAHCARLRQVGGDLAARIVACCDRLIAAMDRGDMDSACRLACGLGELTEQWAVKAGWEKHALRGLKTWQSTFAGGRARWTAQGWKARAPELRALLEKKRARHPNLPLDRLRQMVARDLGCSKSTVKRYT